MDEFVSSVPTNYIKLAVIDVEIEVLIDKRGDATIDLNTVFMCRELVKAKSSQQGGHVYKQDIRKGDKNKAKTKTVEIKLCNEVYLIETTDDNSILVETNRTPNFVDYSLSDVK